MKKVFLFSLLSLFLYSCGKGVSTVHFIAKLDGDIIYEKKELLDDKDINAYFEKFKSDAIDCHTDLIDFDTEQIGKHKSDISELEDKITKEKQDRYCSEYMIEGYRDQIKTREDWIEGYIKNIAKYKNVLENKHNIVYGKVVLKHWSSREKMLKGLEDEAKFEAVKKIVN